ncbi:hypothetical protein V5O48_007664 [Marasmius crinis-equi]|uniref:Uncharacterized protein n=1 Tax=Marasmius crinis-equi TaxID=585013 RepID=A0ABR3FGH8_9AGAR
MQDLSTSSEHFIATCISLFTRMVETVPAAVKLTDVVAPLEVKPVNVTLDLTPTGELRFKGYVRLLSSDTVPNNSTVTISWNSRVGAPSKTSTASATFKALQAGRGVWGFTAYYYFDAPVDSTSGISTFFIEIDGTTHDNGGGGYPMQDVAFVVPSLSNVADDGSFSITAAVLKSFEAQNAHAVIAFPAVQLGRLESTECQFAVI